jgi:Holliday junction DNA helicase RuvA
LSPTSLVLEAGGVGYDIRIPLSTHDALRGKEEACVYTHLHVREDDMRLFGFATTAERELFRFLVSVSGVGPSIALAGLCALSPEEVAQAISSGDHRTLQRIKGVGRKTAERIALELRDRVEEIGETLGLGERGEGETRKDTVSPPLLRSGVVVDAISALMALGFDRKAAEERVDTTYRQLQARRADPDADPPEVEVLIKECLRSG